MKIIFFGSSEFSRPILEALKAKEEVLLAVTQPDRKKGRSLKIASTPVKRMAEKLDIKTYQPEDVNSKDVMEYLKKFDAELFVVVSFGAILSSELLDIPKLYSVNVHASLLPKYRGAAPINWAIANGETKTGITIIKMNEKMDEGEIILKKASSISNKEDAVALRERLSREGCGLLLDSIDLIKKDAVTFVKQIETEATYAPKLKKEDGLIDWCFSAQKIYNRIRAFVPWPGCFTCWGKKILKIWKAVPDKQLTPGLKPGRVLEIDKNTIVVNTGEGVLKIEELQLEGKRRMKVEEFIAGHRDMKPGINFMLQS